MIEIDSSYGEGGGQIIRTSVALSALTKKPFRLFNIRAKRDKPGLRSQHLHAIKAVGEICNAKISDMKVGSNELVFEPGDLTSRDIIVDIGTAGSTNLVLQAMLPVLLYSGTKTNIQIKGGTNNNFSPPIDYIINVFSPMIKRFGGNFDVYLVKRGYYPKGGGLISISTHLSKLKRIELVERGKLVEISGIANASEELRNARVVEREVESIKKYLSKYDVPMNIVEEYCKTYSVGTTVSLFANFENTILGADSFGERGRPSEDVGEEAANKLIKEIESDGVVDSHLTDQLIPYLGLVGGEIKTSKITEHTKTNMWVTEKFLPVKFSVVGNNIICKI